MAPPPPANLLASADLAAFVTAVDAASVHGAADALNLTQSAVTKRLQALERRAGVQLLERGRFGVRPTAAGRLLYPEAKQALIALQRADEVLDAHRRIARHALTLSASHTIGEFLLPGWLAAFRTQEPQMRAQVEIVNSPGVLHAVRGGEAQIGFVEGIDELDGLQTLCVQRDRIVVVIAASHRWARRRTVSAAELRTESYVTREAGSGTRAFVDAALAGVGIDLEPTTETASLQSVKRALATTGFSLLSELAVEAEQRTGILRSIPLREVALVRELHAVRSGRPRTPGPATRFWRWLERLAASQDTVAGRAGEDGPARDPALASARR
jgi:DNA-binding transcriptional LysR family regulator